jgi:hypothetical protein
MKPYLTCILTCVLTISALPVAGDASAHGIHSQSSSQSICPGKTAKAPVRGYYAAVVRHDARRAKSCLTPYYAQQLARVIGPDWQNVATLRALKVTEAKSLPHDTLPGNVPSAYARPYAFAQVDAEFIVRYYRVVSSSNGLTIRFIYVVKQHRDSPWRIAAIGSGP